MVWKKKVRRTVDEVIDGDTFRTKRKTNGSHYVRLAGVNAPEINARGGKAAKAKLKRLLGKKPVTVESVGRSYGRVVANVKNGRKSINKKLRK